jgi:hypothetical protein
MFTEVDLRQMASLGITESQALEQIKIFQKSTAFARLAKPCTLGDGIANISPGEMERYVQLHRDAELKGRFVKFVPASGAATRMFQSLLKVCNRDDLLQYDLVRELAEKGDIACREVVRFVEGIRSFAFFEDLAESMARDDLVLESLMEMGQFRQVLLYLLTEQGLNYACRPKGLLKFHRYSNECRTATEEHLVEAAHYARTGNGVCRIHFTVSPEHKEDFERFCNSVKPSYEERWGVRYEISFSCQKPSTSTIAVDAANRPVRDGDGRLVFRPGGHGSLLENLNDLGGDLVYIKNIDNLTPDHLKGPTFLWKKILGGCLVDMEERTHSSLRRLKRGASPDALAEAEQVAFGMLRISIPQGYRQWPPAEKRAFLGGKLNRPIRVCGVVRNSGEPGGAPFWVEDQKAGYSIQIVEKAQVDFDSPGQSEIWMSSTHFNPVDLVCALRDYEGDLFDLKSYTNPEAVFISNKSRHGECLKALELPGLWNGSMADWITMIVEVPAITFNPVKTVLDLLRPEHMQEAS